jgi:hypothetical protein
MRKERSSTKIGASWWAREQVSSRFLELQKWLPHHAFTIALVTMEERVREHVRDQFVTERRRVPEIRTE